MHNLDYESEIIEEFQKRQKKQKCVSFSLFAFLFIGILYLELNPDVGAGSPFSMDTYILGIPSAILCGLVLLLIVGCLIFSIKNWRCPHCNTYLGKVINPKHCNHCGTRLKHE